MSFAWTEYLNLARELAGHSYESCSKEAKQRTAVSRAYYAAFCHTRDYAAQHLGFKPGQKSDDHWKLRQYLQDKGDQWTYVAQMLQQLRELRNKCDYSLEVRELPMQVSWAIDQAQQVIDKCA